MCEGKGKKVLERRAQSRSNWSPWTETGVEGVEAGSVGDGGLTDAVRLRQDPPEQFLKLLSACGEKAAGLFAAGSREFERLRAKAPNDRGEDYEPS